MSSSSSTRNQLERRSYTCRECDSILTVLSSPTASPPYCPHCNLVASFTSSTPFEAIPDEDEDDEESQFLETIPTVEISSSMLRSSSSDDSTLPCAICRDDFVVGESARRLPCNHLYHNDCIVPWLTSRNSCPLCRFELRPPVASSGEQSGLTLLLNALNLQYDLEEETEVTLDLHQS